MTCILSDAVQARAKDFVNFINKSPSPFHAVEYFSNKFSSAGFKELKESEQWDVKPNDKFYVTKNKSMLVAVTVGGKYKPGNGFTIIGAHTDSPCPKIKPKFNKERAGYISVGVELYGGGIWHTWFDRDLTVAGRVVIDNNGKLEQRLVHIPKPILRIPSLAIHLDRDVNNSFAPNKETHVRPIIATKIADSLCKAKDSKDEPPVLLELISKEINCKPSEILGFDLSVADTQPAALGGAHDEFVFAPRLDNLHSSYAAAEALMDAENLENDTNCRIIALFDNEEVGSLSAQGAESAFFGYILKRLAGNALEQAIGSSLCISADMAHALHPNYQEKHEENHQPSLHGGIVLKVNSNQRYATTSVTSSIIKKIGMDSNIPIQTVVVRNDIPCGSTIGPITAAGLGIATVDIGAPQLSMHSVREMCCSSSVDHAYRLSKACFEKYPQVWSQLS